MNLNQVTIPSINVEKAVTFYQTLGLRLIVDSIPRYARFECPDGNSTFSIHEVEALPKGQGITIYFEVNNLEETVLKLQLQGIVFKSLPEDKPWLWSEAHLNDLDGNHIIIYHAGENRKNPPWRIS